MKRFLVYLCFISILTGLLFFSQPAESRPAMFNSSKTIVKAIQKNTRQIFKPTFKIQSRYSSAINDVAVSPDGTWFASASGNHAVQVWNVDNGQREVNLTGHNQPVRSVAFVENLEEFFGTPLPKNLSMAPAGKAFLVTGSEDGTARLWRMETRETLLTFRGHTGSVTGVAPTRDGKRLITSSLDGTLRIWDLRTASPLSTIQTHEKQINGLVLAPDNQSLATAGSDGRVQIWSMDGKPILEWNASTGAVLCIAWSSDGRFLVTGHEDGQAYLWNPADGSKLATFTGHEEKVNGVAFTQDHRFLATASQDKTLRIWNVSDGREIRRLEGHQKGVNAVTFASGKDWLISGGTDQTLRVWNQETGKEIARLVSMQEGWAVVTPEGYFDGTLDGAIEDRLDAIQWAGDQHSFALDGFLENYYRPALLGKLLAKKDVVENTVVPVVSDGFYLPPKMIIKPVNPDANGYSKEVDVSIDALDQGGGIQEIRLFHNQKIIDKSRIISSENLTEDSGEMLKTVYRVELVNGQNVLKTVGLSKDLIESEPIEEKLSYQLKDEKSNQRPTAPDAKSASTEVASPPTGGDSVTQASIKPKLHIFVVGINQYQIQEMNLDFSVLDAKGVLDFFLKKYINVFNNITTYEIYDQKATKKQIETSLDSLQRIPPEDTVVLYFAGHGVSMNNRWYFIPTNFDGEEKSVTTQGLSSDELKSYIAHIGAQKILLLIDACYSGSALPAFASFDKQRSMAKLARATGIHIATATTGNQAANELTELGHGIFTYSILTGLDGQADKKPEDGTIFVKELLTYMHQEVPLLVYKYKTDDQTPVFNSTGMDFQVVKE
ncbi:MAG: caspase family protein [Magnetococcus sp. DMHC-6]